MAYKPYSGKPSGTLHLPQGKEIAFDCRIPATPSNVAGSEEFRLVYVNVHVQWKITNKRDPNYYNQVANLRLSWLRLNDPDGSTAYQDYTISSINSSFLVTLMHMESPAPNKGGYWRGQLDSPHANGATLHTRYNKGCLVKLA